jgi:hypothetical protein
LTARHPPSPAHLVEVFTAASGSSDGVPLAPSGDVIVDLSVQLHANNHRQWDREDDARRTDAGDTAIAAAKRDIDELNGIRHGLIEGIDRAFSDLLPTVEERTPLVTESPGMVIDRLSVLVLRIASTESRAAAPEEAGYAARLPRLRSQLRLLEEAASTLFEDLETGRSRFATYESLKLYGPGTPPAER